MKRCSFHVVCATVWWFAAATTPFAQTQIEPDPFAGSSAGSSQPSETQQPEPEVVPKFVPVYRFEAFSLPMAQARKALATQPVHADLYQWLDTELEKENSKIKLELFTILCATSGQRSKVEEIILFPHPTDFDPPHVGAKIDLPAPKESNDEADAQVLPITPVTPTQFESTDLGFSLEIDGVVGGDKGETIFLSAGPLLVKLASIEKMTPAGDLLQAHFTRQQANNSVTMELNRPTLLGTMNPPERATGAVEERRVWFLFCTVTRS